MKKLSLFMIIFFILSGCHNRSIFFEDLAHHRFSLIKLNNQNVKFNTPIFIEFGEQLTVNGQMCNQFSSQVTLNSSNFIYGNNFVSSDRLCDNKQLNQLDLIIEDLIKNGATIKLSHNINQTLLQLNNNRNEIIFELNDLM